MDPNETLRRIREITHAIETGEIVETEIALLDLAELIEALDKWLSARGYLPTDWQKGR